MDNILTLEQIQKMSLDETINAYRCGYTLYGSTEAFPQLLNTIQSSITTYPNTTNLNPIYPSTTNLHNTTNLNPTYPKYSTVTLQTDSHYTLTDLGIIAAAIGISVGLLAIIIRYMIKKEEERIVKEIKQTVESVTQKAGIVERLLPLAERIGERILAPKQTTSQT